MINNKKRIVQLVVLFHRYLLKVGVDGIVHFGVSTRVTGCVLLRSVEHRNTCKETDIGHVYAYKRKIVPLIQRSSSYCPGGMSYLTVISQGEL